jgi:hypothetical protein
MVIVLSPPLITNNTMDNDIHKEIVITARSHMINKRIAADVAASEYRAAIRSAVNYYKSNGLSLRKAADNIGISEGALRDLLRPEGMPRRSPKKKKVNNENNK